MARAEMARADETRMKLILLASTWFDRWPHRARVVGLMAGMVLALLLIGCGSAPYWTQGSWGPQLPPTVTEVDGGLPCGKNNKPSYGCYDPVTNKVSIRRRYSQEHLTGLQSDLWLCTLSHEVICHSIKGLQHDDRPVYAVDCCDGTFWIPPL